LEQGDQAAFERETVVRDAPPRGEAVLVVSGVGLPLQARIRVPGAHLEIDWPARRAVLRARLEALEAMPRHDPNQAGSTPALPD
ncbi:MAG TPA: hypothetical protein VGS41_17730, partial [Chthonomonadales bacterium]|nr:hypothetical protein [Chthonomonadales bacterium]